MGVDHSLKSLDPYAVSSIRQHARSLLRNVGFIPEDYQDIVQYLTIHLWEQLNKYDPSRGKLTTFIDRVVRNKAADLLKTQQAARRNSLQMESIHDAILTDDGESAGFEEIAEIDAVRSQRGLSRDPFERTIEMRIDLVRALAQLTPEQIDLCRRLLETPNRRRIAADLGISKDALYQAIYRIRDIFKRAGLNAYFEKSSDTSPRVVVNN